MRTGRILTIFAAVTAMTAGCGSHLAPAPSSSSSTPPAPPPAPVLATTLPPGTAQVIVNGQDGGRLQPVVCSTADGFIRYTVGETSLGVTVVITDDDIPSVRSVTIGDIGGVSIGYAADVSEDPPRASRNGTTLTVTGAGDGTDSTNPARIVPTRYQIAVACP